MILFGSGHTHGLSSCVRKGTHLLLDRKKQQLDPLGGKPMPGKGRSRRALSLSSGFGRLWNARSPHLDPVPTQAFRTVQGRVRDPHALVRSLTLNVAAHSETHGERWVLL